MNISNYYWYFSGVLTPKFCDDVIAYANSKEEVMARTGGYGDKKLITLTNKQKNLIHNYYYQDYQVLKYELI